MGRVQLAGGSYQFDIRQAGVVRANRTTAFVIPVRPTRTALTHVERERQLKRLNNICDELGRQLAVLKRHRGVLKRVVDMENEALLAKQQLYSFTRDIRIRD